MANWNKKLSLELGARVNPSLLRASDTAITKLSALDKKEKALKSNKALIGKLQADQMMITKTNRSYKTQINELKSLQRAYQSTGEKNDKLAQKISKKQKTINQTNAKLQEQRKNLKALGSSLKRAGIDTANLASEEKRLERALEHTRKKARLKNQTLGYLNKGLSKLKYVALGASAAITTMGVTAFASVNRFSTYGDQLAKTADKLGISTDKLQQLRYAAERTGVTTQTFDMAMQRMARRLSEAANGAGEAKGAIEELGLSAIELNQLKPDQALGLIADRLDQITNQKDRIRLAMKFFDSEGVALVNTLKGGSKALIQYGKDAERVGYVLNETSLRMAEKNKDAYLDMKTSLEAMSFAFSDALAPAFTEAFKNTTKWISENKHEVKSWANTTILVATSVGKVLKGLGTVIGFVFKSAWRFGEHLGIVLFDVVEGIKSVMNQFRSIFDKLNVFNRKTSQIKSLLSFGLSDDNKPKKVAEKIRGNRLNFNDTNDFNLEDFFKVTKEMRQINNQNNHSKVNHVTVNNTVTVNGNGDRLSLMEGVKEATQKALYDYQLGGI